MTGKKQKGGTIDLLVENYKMAKHLHVVLVAGCNEIGGPNGAGKSSGLDAVSNLFGGKKLTPPEPVHEGADGYKLQAKLSELGLCLTRVGTLEEDGILKEEFIVTPLEGEGAGRGLGRPKELMDKLIGAHSMVLKPLIEMSNADRIALLQRCAGLDFADLDAKRVAIYAERTSVNHATEALENRLEAMPSYPDAPTEPVAVEALMTEVERRGKVNTDNYTKRRDLYDSANELAQSTQECERLEAAAESAQNQADVAKGQLAKATKAHNTFTSKVDAMQDLDVQSLNDEISGAAEVNDQIRANFDKISVATEYTTSKDAGTALTGKLREIDEKKKAQLAEAKIPGGLSWKDGQVRLKNKPLEQASQVEQMDVDIAVAIAQNPKVPIILVHEGSLYDKVHRGKLDKVGKKHGVYILFERVIDTEEDAKREGVAVFMRDGVGINIEEEVADADSK